MYIQKRVVYNNNNTHSHYQRTFFFICILQTYIYIYIIEDIKYTKQEDFIIQRFRYIYINILHSSTYYYILYIYHFF